MNPRAHADLNALLKQWFGHDSFRPTQRQVITDTLAGRDVFLVMPTGGGKSLCYQLPAVARDGVTVVISPLIALMQDQTKALADNGVACTVLNSSVEPPEITRREHAAVDGQFRLIYMAPERLMSPAGARLIEQLNIALFAIDEAHCISEWGHDFRPEYRQLGTLRQRFRDTPIMALTATATPRVAEDIVAQLHLDNPAVYRGGFERTNLFYEVRRKDRTSDQIVRYLTDNPDHEGIIYCLSRDGTERMAQKLVQRGIRALPYHAGLPNEQRHQNQHDFVYGDCRVICATIAFGMGIDKPDVRFVIHADLPRHIEGYYQETGRAGRDGLPADCILFFSHGDRAKLEFFIEQKETEQEREHATWQLQQMINFAYTTGCRCVPLLGYFGEQYPGACGHCDNCRNPPEMQDATEDAQKLLSAVARTDQRFGLGHVIDVLRGNATEKVARYRHDDLSVFALGADLPVNHWRRVAEALMEADQLAQTTDQYPTLQLAPGSRAVLRGEADVRIVQPRVLKTKREKPTAIPDEDLGPVDLDLFEKLRQLRRRLATEQAVPPYVVFSDASLRHMAQLQPVTPDTFAAVKGVGDHKLEKYGSIFMDAIREHATDVEP